MNEFDRRAALIAAILGPMAAAMSSAACAQQAIAPASAPARTGDGQGGAYVAMLVYPRMTALDLIGPQYMFSSLMGATVHLVGKTREPVTSDTGVTITPTATFSEVPSDVTVLFTPGGTDGTLAALLDDETRAFMADRGARAQYVTSVCTGSLILAAAGLLDGYRATSHWATRDVLAEFGAIPTDARVVRDRNRITGAGVTAGLDFGLEMLTELRDATYAQAVQLMCEYDPHPPYNSGSLQGAPEQVRNFVQARVAPFTERARGALREIRARSNG